MFTLVPMATAPPSPERLELGPGVFWLRSKSFSLLCLPRALSDFTARGASAVMLDEPGREREGKGESRRGGRDKNPGVGRHWVGGGRKAKSITSFLEHSQKGKDMSQCTDCTSLPHWIEANPLVCEVPSTWAGVGICGDWDSVMCVYMCAFADSQADLYCMLDSAAPEGLMLSTEVQKRVIED